MNTVGRRRDSRCVGDGGDGTKRLRRLEVRLRHSAGHVHTRGRHVVALAHLECTVLGIVGCVVCAPETVVDVLAVCGTILSSWVADLDAEAVSTHEAARG